MDYEDVPPPCPICGSQPDLDQLAGELQDGVAEPTACCQHLVPTLDFGNVAEDLAQACAGQLLWRRVLADLSYTLKEKWDDAAEEGQSEDLEGAYFIRKFVKPCPAVMRVDHLYRTLGDVGTACNVCTPLVWTKDRKAFAEQVLERLQRAVAKPGLKKPRQKSKASARTRKPDA